MSERLCRGPPPPQEGELTQQAEQWRLAEGHLDSSTFPPHPPPAGLTPQQWGLDGLTWVQDRPHEWMIIGAALCGLFDHVRGFRTLEDLAGW